MMLSHALVFRRNDLSILAISRFWAEACPNAGIAAGACGRTADVRPPDVSRALARPVVRWNQQKVALAKWLPPPQNKSTARFGSQRADARHGCRRQIRRGEDRRGLREPGARSSWSRRTETVLSLADLSLS